MDEEAQQPEDPGEGEVDGVDPTIVSLARENQALKTWIVGMVSGCEGCTEDATKWAELMGLSHEG